MLLRECYQTVIVIPHLLTYHHPHHIFLSVLIRTVILFSAAILFAVFFSSISFWMLSQLTSFAYSSAWMIQYYCVGLVCLGHRGLPPIWDWSGLEVEKWSAGMVGLLCPFTLPSVSFHFPYPLFSLFCFPSRSFPVPGISSPNPAIWTALERVQADPGRQTISGAMVVLMYKF